MDEEVSGPQSQSARGGEEKTGTRTRIKPGRPIRTQSLRIHTELSPLRRKKRCYLYKPTIKHARRVLVTVT